MNLFSLLAQLKPTATVDDVVPRYLLGAFKRKTISFYNGLTDEKTIVYWFQSRSFSIDLRLKDTLSTPVVERQGWIGDTLWDQDSQLLSWDIPSASSYQNHVQWPEPARLHPIGNAILEFSPSNVYVEDWRQQVAQGVYLGLRLKSVVRCTDQVSIAMDGGLIICDQHIAYVQSRLPEVQTQVAQASILTSQANTLSDSDIESFEVSIGVDGIHKYYSTQTHQFQKPFDFEGFEIVDEYTLKQAKKINGIEYVFYFEIDVYQPSFSFQNTTNTTENSAQWFAQEHQHLSYHAKCTV